MDDVAIRVENVSKNFMLPHEKVSSIKSIFTHLIHYVTSARSYERQHALKDISFEVKKGEFFGIVGRNGSGKSTILKIIAGIYQPTSGRVQLNGKLVPFIELGVGFNPELTGRQNVYLNGALLGFSEKEIDAQYDEIVAFAELEEFMDQKLKNYSSGMQVRLAFSAAIRAKADILLIDEVLAVGDADFQRKCFDYFQQLKGGRTTVIFVSHNMNAVREYCDRAALIDNSKVIDIQNAEGIAAQYNRMFLEKSTGASLLKDKKRWGDGAVTYNKVVLSEKTLSDQKEFTLTLTATAKEETGGLIFGFLIKNASGQVILGMNTQLKKQRIKKLQKGDVCTLSWSVPNIFADGNYIIEAAITRTNGVTCDWWANMAEFTVLKEDHTVYLTAPDINLTVDF